MREGRCYGGMYEREIYVYEREMDELLSLNIA